MSGARLQSWQGYGARLAFASVSSLGVVKLHVRWYIHSVRSSTRSNVDVLNASSVSAKSCSQLERKG